MAILPPKQRNSARREQHQTSIDTYSNCIKVIAFLNRSAEKMVDREVEEYKNFVGTFWEDSDECEDKLKPLLGKKDQISNQQWIDIVCAIIRNPKPKVVKMASADVLRNGVIQWKDCPDGATQIIEQLKHIPARFDELADDEKRETLDKYEKVGEALLEGAGHFQAGKRAAKSANDLFIMAMDNYHDYYAHILNKMYKLTNWENETDERKEAMLKALLKIIKQYNTVEKWNNGLNLTFGWNMPDAIETVMKGSTKFNSANKKTHAAALNLFTYLSTLQLTDERGDANFFAVMLVQFLAWSMVAKTADECEYLKPFIPTILEWFKKDPATTAPSLTSICDMAYAQIYLLVINAPTVLGDYTPLVFQIALDRSDQSLLGAMSMTYQSNDLKTDKMKEQIEQFTDKFVSSFNTLSEPGKAQVMNLFWLISQKKPELLRKHLVFFENALDNVITNVLGIQVLQSIASKFPKDFAGRGSDYWSRSKKVINQAPALIESYRKINEVYKWIARNSEEDTERLVVIMEKYSREKVDTPYNRCILETWTFIAHIHPEPLRRRLAFIKEFRNSLELKETAQHLADVLENRTLVNLDSRVEEAEVKIEDIDGRTVSNAPNWAKEVSRLMNPKSDRDWRLLAQRLGYTAKDIREWSTHPDPCMSMLTEWFSTNRASEATNSVYKELHEIDRLDAANVIKKYLNTAEDEMPDLQDEFKTPPPIFLSYQWGHQPQVKTLKTYLEREGYNCWMDIGQMGGGDSLYEKIDSGIRGAKVVIFCMSEKYSQSANCTREVNLTNALNKPVIPILMENMTWPPAGSMGPIVADKLYIRFFRKDQTAPSADEKYWPDENFTQLIQQIKGYIPDGSNQTVPPPPVARTQTAPVRPKQTPPPKPHSPPVECDVLILATQDKQNEMKSLADKLTRSHYKCRMKLESETSSSSVAGAHVVICGVTESFAKSQSGLRLISDADKYGKPIIPLQLDPGRWPLNRNLQFTTLDRLIPVNCLYIGRKPAWNGNEFDDIIDRLDVYIDDGRSSLRREKSNIPRAQNQYRSSKPPPRNGLAREASDIRIQVRPPTPQRTSGNSSYIPVASRSTNGQRRGNYEDDIPDEYGADLEDDWEQDRRDAKRMQNETRLPQIEQSRNGGWRNGAPMQPPLRKNTYNNVPRGASNSGGSGQRPAPTRSNAPPKRTGSLDRIQTELPKLPSMYRQRVAARY